MAERTFSIIKPDAVADGHASAILTEIDKAGFQILLALSTRLLGYGCAVLARWLVYPSTLIYPKVLAAIALNEPPPQ